MASLNEQLIDYYQVKQGRNKAKIKVVDASCKPVALMAHCSEMSQRRLRNHCKLRACVAFRRARSRVMVDI